MNEERRQTIERMFRARLSWTVLAGVGLVGLTRELNFGVRGALFAVAIGAFVWLNQPLGAWILRARAGGDTRWQPAALGMVLRVVALISVIAFAW